MNWEAVGAVGDLIGGIAVLVTLIYLAVQLKQTQKMLKGQAAQARTELGISLHRDWSSLGLQGKKLSDYTEHEKLILKGWLHRSTLNLQNLYYQSKLGLLDDMFSGPVQPGEAKMLHSKFAREEYWNDAQHLSAFGAEFVEFINKGLEQADHEGGA